MTEHRSILTPAKIFMISVGFWKYPHHQYPAKLFYKLYSALFVLYFFLYTISLYTKFIITVSTASRLDPDVIKQLAYVIGYLMTTYVIMVCRGASFNDVISDIALEERHILNSEDDDILKSHLRYIIWDNWINLLFAVFTIGTGLALGMENVLRNVEVARYNRHHNVTLERPLLMEVYYFNLNEQKWANLLLVISEVSLACNTLMFLASKVSVYTCILFASSVLKMIQIKFRKMGLGQEDTLAALKQLVVEHQRIIALVDKLNGSIKYLILLEYLLNSLNVAAVSVQLITYDKKMLLTPIFYLCFLLIQVFILGISSNEIKIQSLALSDAAYSTPWHDQSEAVKKILLTVIARTQIPLKLTIGPFRPMVIESAIAVCKASYSYVTLMMHNVQ
ncbi:odorant receptor 30a-like [Cylas formicarius]|uniref:odorant receptor 30a-like n=1 Tax=Cylas formicarius TaxID=197179 RepID=UPI0029586F42|nr:odorant receptor 30a-like [Cylas formicarius]